MFTSLYFLPLLAVTALCWYLAPPKWRWAVALAFSGVFYFLLCAGGPWLELSIGRVWWLTLRLPVGLLWLGGSVVCVWWAALRLPAAGAGRNSARKGWLALGAAGALAPLLCLNYIGTWTGAGWAVPLGISYYSLQLAGYLGDTAAGRIPPERNPARLLCYAMFFLSIVQGPFNRYGDLMPQMERPLRPQARRVAFAAQRMAWGYFQKLAVADRLGPVVNELFLHYADKDTSQLIFGVVAYSVQLYADFAGYTDIALGAGELLGLALPENFRQPYFAQSAAGFWRRWHISLSFWFRDFVYIPLGGSRCGPARGLLNLLAVWLLTGLWHGAGSSFVAWGLYWFLILAASRLLFPQKQKPGGAAVQALRAVRTSVVAGVGWLLFRADSLAAAGAYLTRALTAPGCRVFANYWEMGVTSRFELLMTLGCMAAPLAVDLLHARGHRLRRELAAQALPVRWAVYQCALWAFLFMGAFLSSGSGFLYARF